MLYIEGSVKILPLSIGAEGGALQQEDGKKEPAVVLYLQTTSGVFEVVIPPENIDKVAETLIKAKEEAQNIPKTDLIVSQNIDDAKAISEADKKLKG
jgi:hypothetical protein